MYKKSLARIGNENDSSQAELSNPALQDIIATNHVVFPKKPHEERLSRACKAFIIMIILVLVSIGIIILTLVLAHSRNTLMAIVARSAEESIYPASNHTRLRFLHQRNSTTIANEPIEKKEHWPTTTTVSLTSDNLPTSTTSNVHISSSSVMRTEQRDEYTSSSSSTAQSSPTMKSYPSLNTIAHEQSTIVTTTTDTIIQTTGSDRQSTTLVTSAEDDTTTEVTMLMTSVEPSMNTMKSDDDMQTSSEDSFTTIAESTFAFMDDETTAVSEEGSFATFLRDHFDLPSSTVLTSKQTSKKEKIRQQFLEEDVMDDLLFSK